MTFWLEILFSYFSPPRQADYSRYSNLFVHELSKKILSLQALVKSAEGTSRLSNSDSQWASRLASDSLEILRSVLPALVRLSSRLTLPLQLYRFARRLENSFAPLLTGVEGQGVRSLNELSTLYNDVRQSIEATGRVALSDVAKKSLEKIRAEKYAVLSRHQIELSGNGFSDAERFFLSPNEAQPYEHLLTNLLRNAIEAVEQKIITLGSPPASAGGVVGAIFESPAHLVCLTFSNHPETGLILTVEDTGCGMDEKTAKQFTQPGFSSKSGGQGLGITEAAFRACHGLSRYEVASIPGSGTKITLFLSPPFLRQYLRKPLVVRWGASLLIGAAGVFFSVSFSNKKIPVEVVAVEGYTLVVKEVGKNGKEIGRRSFQNQSNELSPFSKDPEVIQQAQGNPDFYTVDLNKDGTEEVIVFIRYKNEREDEIRCYDLSMEKELWSYKPGGDNPYLEFQKETFTLRDPSFDTLSSPLRSYIVVVALGNYYPAELVILGDSGQVIHKYWHSGHFSFHLEDYDDDGDPEIVFYGMNNGKDWRPFLGIIETDSLPALSQCMTEKSVVPGVPTGKEMLYILFPHITSKSGIEWYPCKTMISAGEVRVESDYILARIGDGRQYRLERRGYLPSIANFYRGYFEQYSKNTGCKIEISKYDSSGYWFDAIETYLYGRRLK